MDTFLQDLQSFAEQDGSLSRQERVGRWQSIKAKMSETKAEVIARHIHFMGTGEEPPPLTDEQRRQFASLDEIFKGWDEQALRVRQQKLRRKHRFYRSLLSHTKSH